MPRVTDDEIREALKGAGARYVADQFGVPLRRVCRAESNGRSAHDPNRPKPEPVTFHGLRNTKTASDPGDDTKAYWAGLGEPTPPPRLKHTARMVPDDRADEGLTLEGFLGRVVAAVRGGRGAA